MFPNESGERISSVTKQLMRNDVEYTPTGSIYDITVTDEEECRMEKDRAVSIMKNFSPPGSLESYQTTFMREIHTIDTYIDHILQAIPREPYVASPHITTKCIQASWKPHFLSISRVGFEQDNIRLEVIGHRLGSTLPLLATDVSVGGCTVVGTHLLSMSPTAISFDISLAEKIPQGTEVSLRLCFRSTMLESPHVVETNVKDQWFQDREATIEQGSLMCLLAHARVLQIACSNTSHTAQVASESDDVCEAFANETMTIAHQIDVFLSSSDLEDSQKKDLIHLFHVLELPGVDRRTLLNTLVLSMIEAWRRKKEFDIFKVTSKWYTSEDSRENGTASSNCSILTIPTASNLLSSSVTSTKATSEMYRVEAAMIYVALSQFRAHFLRIQHRRTLTIFSWVAAIWAWFLGPLFWFSILYAQAAVMGTTAWIAFFSAMFNSDSVIDYLVSLLGDSDSYVYTSGAIAEKFVLSMVSEMRDGSSLKDDEERFVEKMNSSSSDELWGSSSRLDYLKHALPSDREAMMSLVMAYIKPILLLRNYLLKKRVFTVAVVGEPGSGKTTFVSKAFRTKKYQERTSEHQMHTRHIQSKEEDLVTLFNIFDFPGMNGNDAFAGADVSNLEAMIPALDCMLFFTKLNSRCFLAEELLKKVRGFDWCFRMSTHVYGTRSTSPWTTLSNRMLMKRT